MSELYCFELNFSITADENTDITGDHYLALCVHYWDDKEKSIKNMNQMVTTRIPMAVRAPKRRKKLSKSQRPRKPSFPILSSKLLTCLAAASQTAKSESNTPRKSKLYIYGSRKKGMIRLMSFCFRTIIEEAELYINPNI